jgi:hypothetical protein
MVLEMLWVSSRKKIVSRERKTEKLGSLDDRNVQKFDGYVEATCYVELVVEGLAVTFQMLAKLFAI